MVLVVDSSDHYKVLESKHEMWNILKEKELKTTIFLVMVNKQDLPGAASSEEVSKEFELDRINDQ